MAAGINFNPASFRGSEINRTLAKTVASETTGSVDAYQPSAPAAVTSPGVTFNVSIQQLASAAFQQSLATLTSAGIPCSVVLVNAGEAQPAPGSSVGREEFQALSGDVRTVSSQLRQLQSEVANLTKPKPPTYGGD